MSRSFSSIGCPAVTSLAAVGLVPGLIIELITGAESKLMQCVKVAGTYTWKAVTPPATVGLSKYVENIGDGTETSFVVTHNLGTKDVIVRVYNVATNETVLVNEGVLLDTDDSITIKFTTDTPPAEDEYRVVVIG